MELLNLIKQSQTAQDYLRRSEERSTRSAQTLTNESKHYLSLISNAKRGCRPSRSHQAHHSHTHGQGITSRGETDRQDRPLSTRRRRGVTRKAHRQRWPITQQRSRLPRQKKPRRSCKSHRGNELKPWKIYHSPKERQGRSGAVLPNRLMRGHRKAQPERFGKS